MILTGYLDPTLCAPLMRGLLVVSSINRLHSRRTPGTQRTCQLHGAGGGPTPSVSETNVGSSNQRGSPLAATAGAPHSTAATPRDWVEARRPLYI